MIFTRGMLGLLLSAAVAASTTGCVQKVMVAGTLQGARQASAAMNTIQDYEVAKAAAFAGMAQLEGLHWLAPQNADGLFMLTRGWGGVSFAFIVDEAQEAREAGNEELDEYNLARAGAGFERGVFYGKEMLALVAGGFDEARKSSAALTAWLEENFTDASQADMLLQFGYVWIGRIAVAPDVPELVAELFVGVEFIRRSVALDETLQHGTGLTVLGAYHARSPMAELDQAKVYFERALAVNDGKFLVTKLQFATRYYCAKGDKEMYFKLLNEILAAPDPLPSARLPNLIAKRRARRYIAHPIWQEDCGFGA
jgi:hypothetical protein